MTRLDFAEDFDAVFLWGNTFGLFRDADNRAALAGLARALAPGGAALIETENRQALGEGGGRSWHFGGDDEKLLFLTEDTVDEEARRFGFVVTAVEIATGRRGELAFSWRHYDLEQLRQLAAEAGLRLSAVLGDDPAKIDWGAYASGAPYPFSEEAFGPDAGRRILLYHKQ